MFFKERGISVETQILISNYYNDLIKNKQIKSSKEIASDLGVSTRVINIFWHIVGIDVNSIGYDYTPYAKQVLIHTQFQKNSIYYKERQRVIEELKEKIRKEKNYEIIMRFRQISELKKARAVLVSTLNQISEQQKVKVK